MTATLVQFIQLLFGLVAFVVGLRFLLHFSQADYYNPITQGIVKATNPLVLPLQKLLPPQGRLDLATLVLLILVKMFSLAVLIFLITGSASFPWLSLVIAAASASLKALLDIYFFALIIMIILSWVAPQANHPGAILVYQITEPLMQPIRRLIPSLGGLDLSPIFVFLAINLAQGLISSVTVSLVGVSIARLAGV